MAEEMRVDISRLSKDLYERVIEYSVTEISWYVAKYYGKEDQRRVKGERACLLFKYKGGKII